MKTRVVLESMIENTKIAFNRLLVLLETIEALLLRV